MPKKQKLTMMTAMDANADVFGKAADKISGRLSGIPEVDAELSTYKKLIPADFDDLNREFGFDAVSQYIRSMEAKRMRSKYWALLKDTIFISPLPGLL